MPPITTIRFPFRSLRSSVGMKHPLTRHVLPQTLTPLVAFQTTEPMTPHARSMHCFFSTRTAMSNKRGHVKNDSKKDEIHVEPPPVSFESLGIGKNMRLFLFAVLGVFGTIETWFWCKAIWVWWKNRTEDSG